MASSITVILFTIAGFLAIIVSLIAGRKWAARLTVIATALAASGGLFIYGCGFAQQIPSPSLAATRTVLAVLSMFLGGNSLSDISDTVFLTTYAGQTFAWLVHLLAMYATISAALSAICTKALQRLRLLVFQGGLDIIYGAGQEQVDFGKKVLQQPGRRALVFVDSSVPSSLASEIPDMGAVLFSDASALAADRAFLRRIGMRPGRRQLTVYAMGPDAVQNLQFASALLTALKEQGIRPEQTSLVLSGGEGFDAGSLQALGKHYGYGSVAAFDPAALAARLLTREYPPCDAISFDAAGRAAEDFEALVVGFGQTGQAVLRSLVMQGQFEGSRFRLAVFSPDCLEVNGAFTGLAERYNITFHPFDARSPEMYQYLAERRDSLKYAVVSAGDAKRSQELAGALTRQLSLLRSSAVVYQCSYQGFVRYTPEGLPLLRKGIYTPRILCPGALDRMAMAVNQCYCAGNGLSSRENWARCDYFSRLSSRASADFIPALLRSAGKTSEQVLAGDWNLTEEQLDNLSRTEHLRWCAFHLVMGYEPMPAAVFEQRCEQYRAQMAEHGKSTLRIGKDTVRHLHACLVPWEDLDALSRAENAVTGGSVDYKSMDRNNVLILPQALKAGRSGNSEKDGHRP